MPELLGFLDGAIMRAWVLVSLLITTAAAAQAIALPGWLTDRLRHLAQAYERCAAEHIKAGAVDDASSNFEAHEASLPRACGKYVDDGISAFISGGYERT